MCIHFDKKKITILDKMMSFLWKSELEFWIYGLMSVLYPVTQN